MTDTEILCLFQLIFIPLRIKNVNLYVYFRVDMIDYDKLRNSQMHPLICMRIQ